MIRNSLEAARTAGAAWRPGWRMAGWLIAATVLLGLSMAPSRSDAQGHSHAGHDHGDGEGHGEGASAGGNLAPRISARGDELELVGVLRGGALTIYLDRLADNAPAEAAAIELTIEGLKVTATDQGGGIYRAEGPWLGRPGPVDILFTISAGAVSDLLVGTLEIPGAEAAAGSYFNMPLTGAVTPLRLGLAALAIFLVGGVVALMLERMARPQSVATVAAVGVAVVLAGAVFASGGPAPGSAPALSASGNEAPRRLPDGDVVMPKATQRLLALRTSVAEGAEVSRVARAVGRIISDPSASGYVQTTIRGRVELAEQGWPVIGQRVKRGEVMAMIVPAVNPVDRTSIRGQLTTVEREIGILQRRLDETQKGPESGAPALDSLRSELAQLIRRRAAISQSMAERDQLRLPLHAPVDGIVATAKVIPGQIVESQDVLFEVIDPQRLWVEVAIYDLTILDRITSATAVTADNRSYGLKFLSRGPRLNQQFVPVFFTIENRDSDAIAGTPVSVMIATSEGRSGVVLPQAAVVRGLGGQGTVWVHAGPETFVPQPVVTEGIDGRSVLVTNGLEAGTRIVTSGAALVNQVR